MFTIRIFRGLRLFGNSGRCNQLPPHSCSEQHRPSAELMIWNLKDQESLCARVPGYFTSKKSFGCFAQRLNELGAKEHSLEKLV
jgi:hypothetical protein